MSTLAWLWRALRRSTPILVCPPADVGSAELIVARLSSPARVHGSAGLPAGTWYVVDGDTITLKITPDGWHAS